MSKGECRGLSLGLKAIIGLTAGGFLTSLCSPSLSTEVAVFFLQAYILGLRFCSSHVSPKKREFQRKGHGRKHWLTQDAPNRITGWTSPVPLLKTQQDRTTELQIQSYCTEIRTEARMYFSSRLHLACLSFASVKK